MAELAISSQSRDSCVFARLGEPTFYSQAGIAFVAVDIFKLKITMQCKVKILVRPWPDLPGWFPQP